MLIECLVKREGQTQVSIGKQVYMFMPLTQFDKMGVPIRGIQTTSICEVTAEEHLKYMLSKPGTFVEYVPRQNVFIPEKTPMMGYSIDKYKENYIVTDKEKKLFAGMDGKWNKDRDKVVPFLSNSEAYEWLKAETEVEPEGEAAEG